MSGSILDRSASVVDATEAAIAAAELSPADSGAVQVLRRLASAVDDIDAEGLNPAGKLDNVSIPTYLRYCEALGLTPAGRKALGDGKPKGGSGGKLAQLRAVQSAG